MVLLVHMADRRRLQGEIDKTLKKVNEGVDAFDDVWQKLVIVSRLQVQTATNINQKEKYESELKKEIKKLQRLREQIKTWQSSNEIKEKKPLVEARKNIEQQMERFKQIERETKQKPYSKDALGGAYKFDPLYKEQEDLHSWLQGCNNKLNSKIEELETRLEDLNANKKKRMDKEKIESTKQSLETHKHYLDTLERIGSLLQKSQLSVKKVQEIKYDVDEFIENSDQPDFLIKDDPFEDLELDKYDSTSTQNDSNDDNEDDDEDDDEDDEDDEDGDEDDEDDEEEEETVKNGTVTSNSGTNNNHLNSNNNSGRNRNRGSSSGSSASSTSSSVPGTNEGKNSTNGNLSTDDDKRRRHKSESGLNNQNKQESDSNQCQRTTGPNNTNSTNNKRNAQQNHNNQPIVNSTTNRNRTNSGAHTSGSSSGSTSSSLSNFSSTSKDNKIPPFNHNNVNETNHSSNSLTDPQIPPPLSQSPFAAVVAGTANTNQPPVSFSAAVLTSTQSVNATNSQKSKQPTINSQTSKDQSAPSISPKDSISNTALFLSQQQQQLSNLIAAANGSITSLSQLNGLVLPTELDKKLSDVVLNNSSSSIPANVSANNAHMNSLKSMAENAILNLTPQQQQQQAGSLTSLNSQLSNLNSGFLNNSNSNSNSDIPIASLLAAATLQQQSGNIAGLNDPNDPNTAAALATILAQQKGNINLPAALSALQQQQQQQNFNDQQTRIGLSVQPGNTNNSTTNSQSQQQNVSPSLLLNQQLINNNLTNQETFIQPILGVAPLGKTPLTKDQNQQLVILESAFKKLPHPSDTERMRNYLPRILINTPSYYPMIPPNGHDSIDFLNKLTSDSLFFMFYYMEGTKAQFLAAQALKKLSWRFHTRYMMWFQRFEEPKVITDEYEMGTYVYFDFEKWGQRKKEGFTFEYKYLEDRDLSSY